MLLWRLTRTAYARDPLSGTGAARAGSRWNSPGVRIGYASTSRPLALLEMLVHVTRDSVPDDLILVPIELPEAVVATLDALPPDCNVLPFSMDARRTGDRWAAAKSSLALRVPSVVLPSESNVLVNPLHPAFPQVRIGPPEALSLDRRLFR